MSNKLPDGTLPNVREFAAILAGVTAGPIGGLVAGLIGGLHRLSAGGSTALACGVATILVGAISGLISTKLVGKLQLAKAALAGFVLESLALGLLFVLAPFDIALRVLPEVYIPMVFSTTLGLVMWTYLTKKWPIKPKTASQVT
jgi:LytS/YehU family sensor histidine kinase